jgi:predicted secreted protein
MTAVQQLYADLCACGAIEWHDDPLALAKLKDAVEMEKKQIKEAFNAGYRDAECDNGVKSPKDVSFYSNAEDYYTQTYGGDQ